MHYTSVNLGKDLFNGMWEKAEIVCKELKEQNKIINIGCDIEKIEKWKRKLSEVEKYSNELKKLKNADSIALVGNITTISKQRIYTPTINNKILKGISLNENQMDLIDHKIKELYTKK